MSASLPPRNILEDRLDEQRSRIEGAESMLTVARLSLDNAHSQLTNATMFNYFVTVRDLLTDVRGKLGAECFFGLEAPPRAEVAEVARPETEDVHQTPRKPKWPTSDGCNNANVELANAEGALDVLITLAGSGKLDKLDESSLESALWAIKGTVVRAKEELNRIEVQP